MNEKLESQFALVFGEFVGLLSKEETKKYLIDSGVAWFDIWWLENILKVMAQRTFYNESILTSEESGAEDGDKLSSKQQRFYKSDSEIRSAN